MIDHPFSLFFIDTISKFEDLKKNFDEFRSLSKTIYNFAIAKKENSKTKQVLILKKYGSANNLQKRFIDLYKELNENSKDIKRSLMSFESILKNKEMECYNCYGDGYTYKMEYIREKGTPTIRNRRPIKCKNCNGSGKISIKIDDMNEYYIRCFINLGHLFDKILKNSLKTFYNLIKIL